MMINLVSTVSNFVNSIDKIYGRINFEGDDIIVVLLSILFPFVLAWEERLNKKIDNSAWHILRYINWNEVNRSENYYKWLELLNLDRDNLRRFFINELEIKDQNTLLLPGRVDMENAWLKRCQKELKKSSKIRKMLNFTKYIISIVVIIVLLLF